MCDRVCYPMIGPHVHMGPIKTYKKGKTNRDFNPEPQWPAQDALIESANWEIPGYAKGIYHVLVHDGKVMWEQAIVG